MLPGITPAQETTNLVLTFLPFHAKSILGTLYGEISPPIDIPRLAEMMKTGIFKLDKLVTKRIKLEQIMEAAEAMTKREIKGRWVIMME